MASNSRGNLHTNLFNPNADCSNGSRNEEFEVRFEKEYESDDTTPLLAGRERVEQLNFYEVTMDKLTEWCYSVARKYRNFQREHNLLDASYDIELGPGNIFTHVFYWKNAWVHELSKFLHN